MYADLAIFVPEMVWPTPIMENAHYKDHQVYAPGCAKTPEVGGQDQSSVRETWLESWKNQEIWSALAFIE